MPNTSELLNTPASSLLTSPLPSQETAGDTHVHSLQAGRSRAQGSSFANRFGTALLTYINDQAGGERVESSGLSVNKLLQEQRGPAELQHALSDRAFGLRTLMNPLCVAARLLAAAVGKAKHETQLRPWNSSSMSWFALVSPISKPCQVHSDSAQHKPSFSQRLLPVAVTCLPLIFTPACLGDSRSGHIWFCLF